jgi:4-diphosphocytidyl-2-C-methyl-D-erythritol kinase
VTPLRLEAPAKLNLSLAVVGRRSDGLHELVSEMVLLELADRLLLMPGCSGLRVEGDPALAGATPPGAADNLAWRGLLAGLGGEPELACLALEKRIPVAAGLGGGSSDGAAAWRLGRRWARRDAHGAADDDVGLLAAIGADVPFFAAATPAALVEGIGERVTPHAPPAAAPHVVLAHPPFDLPTAGVFAEVRRTEWSRRAEADRNDLLAAALRLRPALAELMGLVTAAGGQPQLTGSGPTIFARTGDPERAAGIAARLRRAGVVATQTRLRSEAASIESLEDGEEA